MSIAVIDKDSVATGLASRAQGALGRGETQLAKSLYKQAGETLEKQVSHLRGHSAKHLARFLAASQYYHGGHYQEAERVCQEVRVKMLPAGSRRIYSTFLKDLRERVRPDYKPEVRKVIAGHWKRKKFQAVLDVLKEHQYVIEQDRMAFLRAICCQRLKEYQPAKLFYLDAIQFGDPSPDLVAAAVNLALILVSDVNLDEAWRYVQRLSAALAHPLVDVAASLIRFLQALGCSTETERREFFAEQVTTFTSAWGKYQTLPANEIDYPFARSLLTLGLESTVIGYFWVGKVEKAKALCEDAIRFAPDSAALRTLRAVLTYPAAQAIEDCREAIRLGETTDTPYYLLAHAALVSRDFAEADALCEEALRRHPDPVIRADLLTWQAVARTHLGSRRAAPSKFDRDIPAPRLQETLGQRSTALAKLARQRTEPVNGVPHELSLIAP